MRLSQLHNHIADYYQRGFDPFAVKMSDLADLLNAKTTFVHIEGVEGAN